MNELKLIEQLKKAKVALVDWNERRMTKDDALIQVFDALMRPYSDKPIDQLLTKLEIKNFTRIQQINRRRASRKKQEARKPRQEVVPT